MVQSDLYSCLEYYDSRYNEPFTAGDFIAYYHPISVWGDPRAYQTTIILGVDPEKEVVPTLDNGDYLFRDSSMKRLQ
jgi:hypothetical protein